MVNTVVWLHILGPYWCVCVSLFGSSLLPNSATTYPQAHQRKCFSRRPCPDECSHCRKIEQQADSPRVRRVAAATANKWDRQALRREQLADDNLETLLQDMEAGQRLEWRDINDWGSI